MDQIPIHEISNVTTAADPVQITEGRAPNYRTGNFMHAGGYTEFISYPCSGVAFGPIVMRDALPILVPFAAETVGRQWAA